MRKSSQTPVVAIYLDQNLVFDLLAMLEDGIATVAKVSEESKSDESSSSEVSGSSGLNKAFSSLLAVSLTGKRAKLAKDQASSTREEERVHTSASLFFKLRMLLEEEKYLKLDDENYTPRAGDFVEFSCALSRNPLLESMSVIIKFMELEKVFSKDTSSQKKGKKEEGWAMKEQFKSIIRDLGAGGTTDVVSNSLNCGYRSVITLKTAYLNDLAMDDLVDGTFTVVGKVVQNVDDEDACISLMRKATLGRLPRQTLEQIFGQLDESVKSSGLRLPETVMDIEGPVLKIIPIAIFA